MPNLLRISSIFLALMLAVLFFASYAAASSTRASRLLLQEEESLNLSPEVRKACAHMKDELEFEALKEAIERYAIALFIFLLLVTFGFAYM